MKKGLLNSLCLAVLVISASACQSSDSADSYPEQLEVPRGYVSRLQVEARDRVFSFGPFVGYYFKPAAAGDFSRLDFICFNERSFYTNDLPANARLFEGQAQLRRLTESGQPVPAPSDNERIVPVFFKQAPNAWLRTRPLPLDEYLHFHSAYDDVGAVRYGYWLRHVARAAFTYDMGGRVHSGSPLYHEVKPGPDMAFARILEFDHGPEP